MRGKTKTRGLLRPTWCRMLALLLIISTVVGSIPPRAFAKTVTNEDGTGTTYTKDDYEILYKEINTWGNYVSINITIKNTGKEIIDNWEIQCEYDAKISNIWNAEIESSEGNKYSIVSKEDNASIPVGGSVNFGFIGCGGNAKPVEPDDITLISDKDRVETGDNEPSTPGGSNTGSAIVLPEEWSGLGYAVYTGGDKNISLYTNKTSIGGDVHTNKDFYYQGTSLEISGNLEACGSITTNTSSQEGSLQIGKKVENAATIDMPDITKEVYDYIKEKAKSYDSDKTFNSNRVALINSIYVNGRTTFNATEFLGQGILYSKGSITYNVGSVATPDDSRILLCSENGDITLNGSEINMNGILYAPNGTVYVNANNFTLNGRIIAKQVCINGTNIKINASDLDFELIDFLLKPELSITVEGNQKVNRKVIITLAEIGTTNYVKEDTVSWKIYKDNTLADELYRIDEDAPTYLKKELLFKEAGNYVVQVEVKRGDIVYTEKKEFTIVEDLPPIAKLELEEKEYTRNKEGIATIKAKDLSYSPDNDTIEDRTWTIYYDSNNDGGYGKDEILDTKTGKETELTYETKKVGKYKIELEVKEYFEDTIPKLLTDADYLCDNTNDIEDTNKTLEIINTAPEAALDIEKKKFTDIVFTIGNAEIEKINTYSEKNKELEQALKDKDIDARISTVSTSTLTAQDQFAWKEYDHYNYKDVNLPTLSKHIIYDKADIKMLGYSVAPLKDFLYVADDNAGQKIFEFDIQRDATDWHSMEGGGFLFNTTVSDEKNSIKGFCILITQAGLKLIQIDCNNLSGFRNGTYSYVQNAGKLLRTFPINDVYANHHLKIVIDAKTISVFDGAKTLIDNYVLPDNNYGYGFGPIISHADHYCSQQSYFTFKNITMQTVKGSTLSDIINGYKWRENASHFVINLSNDSVPELEENEKLASIAEALLENESPFIGLGTTKNQNQYLGLLNTSQTGGMFLENENLESAMDNVNQYILDSILAKDYTIKDYISTDDIISYIGYYSDEENDEKYEENWEYEYDPTVFGESKEESQLIIKKATEPITKFDQTGAYSIRLKVRDNPVGDNDALDEYRLWSGQKEYNRLLCIQTRPTADVKVEVLEDASDKKKCTVKASYTSADKDHESDKRKGIREELFYYKNIKDGKWTEGRLPNKVDVGETYLIKYNVRDVEGIYSKPAIAIVKTSEFKQNEEVDDKEAPEIFINTAKEVYQVGEEIRIEGYAIDNYGVDTFEMSINGEKQLNTFGRVILNPVEGETLTIKAKAVDIYGNSSEKEKTIQVVDTSDKIAPTIEITSPNADTDLGFNINFIGTIKDETKLKEYSIGYRKEGEDNYSIVAQGTDKVEDGELGQLDISKLVEGVYDILITAEDEAGNLSYYGMRLYISSGITETKEISLKAGIADIKLSEDKKNIEIYGTIVTDDEFEKYKVEYRDQEGKSDSKIIATGTEVMDNQLIATIPVEELQDEKYIVTLFATTKELGTVEATGAFSYIKGSEENSVLADTQAPNIEIMNVGLSEELSDIGVLGTISDDQSLKEYSISLAKAESEDYKVLSTGKDPIIKASLVTIPTQGLESGEYKLKLEATDEYGNSRTLIATITYTIGQQEVTHEIIQKGNDETKGDSGKSSDYSDIEKGKFAVTLSTDRAAVGKEVQGKVSIPKGIKKDTLSVTVGGKEIDNPSSVFTFTHDTAEKVEVVATALTDDGVTVTAKANCIFYDSQDSVAPTAVILSPDADSVLTVPTDIIGNAYDDKELDYYKLEYRMEGDSEYQLLVESKEPKKNEVLGVLDTTKLMNGRYEVRLTVVDKGGTRVRVSREYIVEGNLKVGNMSIGFTDITAAIGGTTVNVNRMYDSRNKSVGDFGYGWTLGMQGMTLSETNEIYEGYQMVQTGSGLSTGYSFGETISHDIIVNYGDGSSDRFKVTFTPERQALVPIQEVKFGFKCVTNPKVKLELVGDNAAWISGGTPIFYDESIYDLAKYKLTNEDGIEIYLDASNGVTKIVDNNDNVIKVTQNGYEASNGKSVLLTRDTIGRVTKAQDPYGNVTTYSYDEDGNLKEVTDSANRSVSFEYDKQHNLLAILDPTGVAVARNEYDENKRLIATIDAEGNRIEYQYDIEGRTQAIKDRNGNTTVYTYDDNGNIIQEIDAYGNKTVSTFDENNNITSTTDALGNTTSYTYDKYGNRTSITNANGTTVTSTYTEQNHVSNIKMLDKTVLAMNYDDAGRMTSISDAEGNKTTYDYAKDGKLTGIADEIGVYQKFTYDADGNVVTATNGAGESESYTYEEDGKIQTFTNYYTYNKAGDIVQSVDRAGNVTSYEYDENGNQIASVDAKGRQIVHDYDDLGNLVKTTYPDGTFETFTYDAEGNTLTVTDRSGLAATMKYDKLSRMTKKSYEDGTTESYEYDAVGNIVSHTSTSGAKTTYTYDNCYRNTAVTDGLGNTTTFAYDDTSKLIKQTDAKGNTVSYEYDGNGNQIKTIYADGSSVEADYDTRNRVVTQKDQYGNKTHYEYDGANRLTKVTDAIGNSYTYTYDANGNLIKVEDANEHVTTYRYDGLGRVEKITNALGKTTSFTYDETGNLIEYKDYAGTITTNIYDGMDRLISKVIGKEEINFTYDAQGLLVKVEDKSGTITYAYDKYNRLSTKNDAKGNMQTYTYDEVGRLKEYDNGFGKTNYEYDLLDRVTRVIGRNGEATVYEYDVLGNRTAVKYANGVTLTYTYDACQRLKDEWVTDKDGNTISRYVYRLGKAGERLAITETDAKGNETEITYAYDDLNRLEKEEISIKSNILTNIYEYDAVSNRVAKETTVKGDVQELASKSVEEGTLSTGRTEYSYNALNQLIIENTENGSKTYTYDDNGNLIKQAGDKNVNYSYDSANRLLQATTQNGNDVTVESYTYDYAGNRTSKTDKDSNTTYFIVDSANNLSTVTAETDESGKETAFYTLGDDLISMEKNGSVWCYVYDGHGSTRALIDGDGTVTDTYSYDAYGVTLTQEGTTENDFLYTGEQHNAGTDLCYLRARYMSPTNGTFISMDSYQGSINDPVSLHKYLYANANPVMYTDPSGYMGILLDSMCSSIIDEQKVTYDAVIANIGMRLISTAKGLTAAIVVKEIVEFIYITSILFEGIQSGTDYEIGIAIGNVNDYVLSIWLPWTKAKEDTKAIAIEGEKEDHITMLLARQ